MNLIYGQAPDQPLPSCDEAYNIFLGAGNRLGAADTIRLMADFQAGHGHLQQAIATDQRALAVLQELGEHAKTGLLLNNMAIIFATEGKLDRAEQLYRLAKADFEQAGDRANTKIAVGNIADILYLRGNLPGAAKLYGQALEIDATLDHKEPEYLLYRFGDLELTRGHVQDAHRLVQEAVDASRSHPGTNASGSISELGVVLKAEGDLQSARRQYQSALDLSQKMGDMDAMEESQVALVDLALEEGHADQAEPLLRAAISQFEKEKVDPDTTSAYTVLSRALLMQGNLEESRKAIQHAAELGHHSPDPALTLPIAIQTARIEVATAGRDEAGHFAIAAAGQQLRSTIATAQKLGYFGIECEARLALAEVEIKANPSRGRSELETLEKESHEHGLELLSHKAELLASVN